jgi:hypothetical protein
MNTSQYELLQNAIKPEPQLATARCLYNQTPRTLVFGYTTAKDTFHVYLDAGAIHKVVYSHKRELLEYKSQAEGLLFTECVPDKALYPESCDFEFCAELKRRDVHMHFTGWNDSREGSAFYGRRRAALIENPAEADLGLPENAEGWNLYLQYPVSETVAQTLNVKLKELLVSARTSGLRTLEEARRIRAAMYAEMDKYRNLGAREASAEWMLVSVIECALGLPATSLPR